MVSEGTEYRREADPRGAASGSLAPGDGARIYRGRRLADVPQQWHVDAGESALRESGCGRLCCLPARSRWIGRETGKRVALGVAGPAESHTDYAPRLRRGLERNRQMEGRPACGPARDRAANGPGAISRLSLRRPEGERGYEPV